MRGIKLFMTALFAAFTIVSATIAVALIFGEPNEDSVLIQQLGLLFGRLAALALGSFIIWADYKLAGWLSDKGVIYGFRG